MCLRNFILVGPPTHYTWSRSADILRRDGDPNVRNVARGKQSRIDHILISPPLMNAVKKIEHVNYGRRVSDHSAVVLTLDWAETDKGQGVFRCGAVTHKNKNYQVLCLPEKWGKKNFCF